MRLAVDPAALAWALAPQGSAARALLLQHEGFAPAEGLARLRGLRPRLEAETGLARGELWELLDALLARVQAVEPGEVEEFLPLARRLAGPGCAPTLALALALEVDAVLAGARGFEGQSLVPVLPAWPGARQAPLA